MIRHDLRRYLTVCVLVAAALCLGAAGPETAAEAPAAKQEPDDKDVQTIAQMVVDSLPKLKGNRIAVMPLSYLDGSFSVEGKLLADLTFLELSKSDKVDLLERERLSAIVEEHKLGRMGLLDPKSTQQLGKLAGVNGFLVGDIVDLGHKLRVSVKLVDTESKVVEQKTILTERRIKTPATPLWEDIEKVKQKNKEKFQIEIWTEKTEYRVGDEIVIKFRAARDCHVTVFNMGTSGQIAVLFPNRFYATNYVKANQEIQIPGRFQNFKIRSQGPPGLEKLKIFATTSNVPLLPQQYGVSIFRSLDPKERSVTRDLAVTLINLDQTAWAEGSFEFEVKKSKDEKLQVR